MATLAYQEIVDLIADANPARVISFRPSEQAQARLNDLVEQEKTEGLAEDERRELDQYMQLEHVMRLAKARVRQRLSE